MIYSNVEKVHRDLIEGEGTDRYRYVLVHPKTGRLVSYIGNWIRASDCLFKTCWIPFVVKRDCVVPRQSEVFLSFLDRRMIYYDREMELLGEFCRQHEGKKVLCLLDGVGDGTYECWSFVDRKRMFVYSFTGQNSDFTVSNMERERCRNTSYVIFTPSPEFVAVTGLTLANSDADYLDPDITDSFYAELFGNE